MEKVSKVKTICSRNNYLIIHILEETVINEMKNACRISKLEYAKHKMNTTRNKMFDKSPVAVKDGLSDKDLIKWIVTKSKNHDNIKFESDASAIANLYKRSRHDVKRFVERANFIIRDSKSKSNVTRCQEGVTRIVQFVDVSGRVEVTKQFGNVFLSSFIEFDQT